MNRASLPLQLPLPLDWGPKLFELDVDDVWNAFFLHALLSDHRERGEVLVLPHKTKNTHEHVRVKLRERSSRDSGTQRENWNHACDVCCYVFKNEHGEYRESSKNLEVLRHN